MTATAAYVITNALRLYGILDQVETASASDLSANVPILNDMLRSEHQDAAASYLMNTVTVQLPMGVSGSVYTFSIGTASASYLVQNDAVGVKSIWMNDVSPTVNRETRQGPKADVVRTTFPGMITKWHQERQADGSILVTAWQPPRAAAQALIEYGGRIPALTNSAGTDIVQLPPEGIHDATLMLGLTVCGSYGRPADRVDPVTLARAQAVDKKWKEWARGQQWLRFVRS